MEKLIYKYLQNKLTKAEKLELREWLREDPENARLFKNFVGHWNLKDFDVELMKYRIWQKMPHQQEEAQGHQTYFRSIHWMVKVAAILVLALSVSIYFVFNRKSFLDTTVQIANPVNIEKVAAKGQKLTVKLPDGTIVKLNAESKITFPEDFSTDVRNVQLTGEAFFDVVRDESKPFKIFSKNIEVEVLGTSFNVNSYPDQHKVSVAVRSGKVAVRNVNMTMGTVLERKEKLVLSGSDGTFRKESIVDEQMAYGWIDNYLSFNDLNLEEGMALVSKWFDVEYVIVNKRKIDKLITAKFNNPSLKNVMENLSYSYEFDYEINENGIIIR